MSLTDAGYLVGEGVFATMRGYDGACFRPERHLDTLMRGAAMFGIEPAFDVPEILALADEAARRVGEQDVYVRVTLTRGERAFRADAAGAESKATSTLSILARPLELPSNDDYANGVRATFVTPRRIPPACMDSTVKTTSYAAPILAQREAHAKGCAEGIQRAVDGSLACGTMSNLFVVVDHRLLTPSLDTGCRNGVTRQTILELADRAGLHPSEERLDPDVLDVAREVFLTNTRIECLPVAEIDGRRVGLMAPSSRAPEDRFSVAHELRRRLRGLVASETAPRRTAASAP